MRRIPIAAALAVLLVACSSEEPPVPTATTPDPKPTAPPHVVLVVLDTLRADHLSCYGYERETSPNLDALCAQSTVYERAWSASSWTLPSHASLFTGLMPIRHGAHNENRVLDGRHPTLAEALGDAGYDPIAVVSNAMLATDRKLDRGFRRYFETWRVLFEKHPKLFPDFESDGPTAWKEVDNPIFRAAARQLRPGIDENSFFRFRKSVVDHHPDEPLFLFVNLVGVHSPYDSSGPFIDRFLRHPEMDVRDNRWPDHYAGRIEMGPELVEHLVDLYDAEILHADHVVGLMIEELKRAGLWEDTLFIVTSDHGESLGEHGHMSHVFSLHEPLTRIPLIVHHPPAFAPGVRVRTPVHLVDLFPTILEAAGVDVSAYDVDGRPLPRSDEATGREVVAEYYYPWEQIRFLHTLFPEDAPRLEAWQRRLRAITRGDMKLVWASDGRHELYDLARDPDEQNDLIQDPAHAATRDELLAALERFVAENGGDTEVPTWDPEHPDRSPGARPEGDLDPETLRQLEELGYL